MADNRHAVFTVDDETKLDGVGTGAPPGARTLTAGAGLTGGGDLTADRALSVQPSPDGSIVVDAAGVAVGVISDDQHGERAGGELHAEATEEAAGFMPAATVTRIEELEREAFEMRSDMETLLFLFG